jgi:hypothetical protein
MSAKITAADMEETRRAALYGDEPQGPVTSLPATSEGDAFSVDDLLALAPAAAPFTMPNGRTVWVHRLGLDDVGWLNVMALKDVKRLAITDPQEERIRYEHAAWVYQVICACRLGPDLGARKVFQPDHADVIRRNLPWETIRKIVALSDRMGEGDDQLPAMVLDFFARAESILRTWSGGLTADSWTDCRKTLGAFASCVSVIRQRKSLVSADVIALAELEG